MEKRIGISLGLLLVVVLALSRQPPSRPSTDKQLLITQAARTCLGDVYDSAAYPGGPPPEGRGACTDVVYYGLLPILNLQVEVNRDVAQRPEVYEIVPNPDLDYRWCPTIMIWFENHWQSVDSAGCPLDSRFFQAGDVVFFDDGAGVAGHVGIVSEKLGWDGRPLLIHNPGPVCVEENALASNGIVGHFRLGMNP